MKASDFPMARALGSRELPLAFVYDDTAYYFDLDCFDDARSTVAVSVDGQETTGIEANKELVSSVRAYGSQRGKVWIAGWFKDCVAYELEHGQE